MTEEQLSLERAVLDYVRRPEYRPQKPRFIAKNLKLDEDQARQLKRLVKRLVKRGELTYGANHLVGCRTAAAPSTSPGAAATGQSPLRKPSADGNRLTGVFRRQAAGFGFVRPSGGAAKSPSTDIYVAADQAKDASTGDVVVVQLQKQDGRGGKLSGSIVEVLERDSHQFVGTYYERGGAARVQVDGKVFSRAIHVGDPGAKNARPNDKVVLEMVRFPSHSHDGEGVITEVLGARGAPGVDTLSIIREFDLPDEFDERILEAARAEADRFQESVPAGRADWTAATVITIDPVDARDFDDAISLERLDNGHWRLGVHIADVSHFVPQGSPLDREARDRGTSVYLPDRVIPMLPEIISNGLASLQPDRIRYTQTAVLEFTAEGVRTDTQLALTAIKSQRRFSYEEVDAWLDKPASFKKKLTPEVFSLLGRMHELAMVLRGRRLKRGALELSMAEVKVDLDQDGRVSGAHRVVNTVSHQIIEEFMLAANEAVAERLAEAGLYFLRRVHLAPDPRKLKALTEFVNGLGLAAESLESRFELQRLLGAVKDQPEQQAVNYAVLRSLQRAVYSPEDAGHYALASDCYCHFTSPIRRYPDLTVHRLLAALAAGKKPSNDLGELVAQGEHCSERERRAESAERELTRIKLLDFLSQRIGEELEAVVTGVEEFGLFVQGVELPAEGLIHISSLADDYYQFDRATHSLTGRRQGNRFRLGDPLRVSVARVDADRRELDFRIVSREPRPKRPREIMASVKPRQQGKRRPETTSKKQPVKRGAAKKPPRKKRR